MPRPSKKGSHVGLPLHGCWKAVELRCLLRFLLEQLGNNLVDDLIDQGANFIWCFGLDWVGDENRLVVRQS